MLEIEVKFRIDDPGKMVERLTGIGAKMVDSGLEKNLLFDKGGELSKAGELLRLRFYCGKADIIHKRKVPSKGYKVREEVIMRIEDFDNGRKLLEALGFSQFRTYEKKRQTWELGEVGILVDHMPHLGDFIEIEASEEKIIETAGKLGLDMKDAIKKSYGDLFEEYCNESGLKTNDILFSEEEKS